jgi:hypothetical protein
LLEGEAMIEDKPHPAGVTGLSPIRREDGQNPDEAHRPEPKPDSGQTRQREVAIAELIQSGLRGEEAEELVKEFGENRETLKAAAFARSQKRAYSANNQD